MANTDRERDGICPTCGKTFNRYPNWNYARPKKFCSPACYHASKGQPVITNCPACGKQFRYLKSWPHKYCSQACYDAVRSQRRLSTECPTCGKTFKYDASWPRKYCSRECAGKATIWNIPNFEGTRFVAICEECGIEFETTPRRTKGRFCSLACFGAWQIRTGWQAGEKHPNWRGGYEPYYGPSWEPARRAVLERDKVCQDCGKTPEEAGRELDVHHIVRFKEFGRERHEEANALDNLIALCNVCHSAREAQGFRSSRQSAVL